jgi:hypothetical protein
MIKLKQTFSFSVAMKIWLFLVFNILSIKVFAQETSIAGIVFDNNSKDRIAQINILNINTGQVVYNNLNGVFKIDAQPGDLLIFSKPDYHNDTVKVNNYVPLAIYMKRTAIQLREVTIRDSALNPQRWLANARRDNSKAYGSLANTDLLSTPSSGGAGLNLDALYNDISRSGRNAKRLRQNIDVDYKQQMIDYRFNRTFVARITNLKDKQLSEFMSRYRPGYYFVESATDYDFISYIKINLKRYLRNPRAYALAPLYPPTK